MRAAAVLLIAALWHSPLAAAEPTVIVDVGRAGAVELQRLKQAEGVVWAVEFGNELLLGVHPEALPVWLGRAGVRVGPERLAPEEIVVRDHVCTVHEREPALTVIGGYEILRKPPALARATRGALVPGGFEAPPAL
jgi:hypothetical protein